MKSSLQLKIQQILDKTDFSISIREEREIRLSPLELRQISEALKIAQSAVVHHDRLVDCTKGHGNILTDMGETAAQIYAGAEVYKFYRDKLEPLEKEKTS